MGLEATVEGGDAVGDGLGLADGRRQERVRLSPGGAGAPSQAGDATWLERIPLFLLLGAIVLMGLFPGRLIVLIDQALLPILNNLNR